MQTPDGRGVPRPPRRHRLTPADRTGCAPYPRTLPSPPLSADAIDFVTAPAVADNVRLLETLAPTLTPLREGLGTYVK